MTFNFGVMTPFGLGTWWEEDHAGRFLSKRADLRVIDMSPSLSLQLNDGLAVGIGIDYVIGQIDLTRQIGVLNPYTQQVADVGQVHMYTDGMSNDAWGWNLSVLAKSESGFSFGALYRSGYEITYDGEASFTQYLTGYADFDAAVAELLPFEGNVPLGTEIEFPDYWTMGVAYSGETVTVSGQYGHVGWSSFRTLPIEFPNHPHLNSEVEENYVNADQYRLGFEYQASEAIAFQAGALYDNTPQPRESMSPLLGDGDRTGACIGLSWIHGKMRSDIGYMYLWFDDRSTEGQSIDGYNGRYDTTAMLFGASLTLTF
jgi:long-chain fatty acid transport protein